MLRHSPLALICAAGLLLPTAAAAAQGKKPAAKKPAAKKPPVASPKPAVKPGGPIVLGTTQLAGDFGQVGTTYTVGKAEPINFTLRSAEYSAVPVSFGDETFIPNGDQKLLVLRFTVHNPNAAESIFNWSRLKFTAIDASDTNQEGCRRSVGKGRPLRLWSL